MNILLLSAAILVGCTANKDNTDWSVNKPLDGFSAKTENSDFVWVEGDVIKMYSENPTGKYTAFYNARLSGQTVPFQPFAHASIAQKATKYLGCYPYDLYDFETGTGTLPSQYSCTDQQFRNIPMSAVKTSDEAEEIGVIAFKKACNICDITITAGAAATINSITLRANVPLAGKGEIKAGKGKIQYLEITEGAREVTFNYSDVTVNGSRTFRTIIPANVTLEYLEICVKTADTEITKRFDGFQAGFGEVRNFDVSLIVAEHYNAKIYESNTYTSFADLVWYEGKYYCAFREGENHVPSSKAEKNGIIHFLQSTDCRAWTEAGTITDDRYDLRDPHFCISPKDGSLLCIYAYHEPGNSWVQPTKTAASVLVVENGILKEKSRGNLTTGDIYERYWIWNITVEGDTVYGVAYYETGTNVAFLSSKDGFNWTHISDIPFKGNEASVNIIDGKAYVLMRNQTDWENSSIAIADAPYTSWTVIPLNYGLHSPIGHEYNGKLYICGRKYYNKVRDGVSMFSFNLPTDTKLKEVYVFPCDTPTRDNAYPGFIIRDGAMRVVYYAIPNGKNVPDIYYTEIPLSMIDGMQ